MKSITIDGKNFEKATEVARDFGYTKDYLGQLCREEKVECRLVGRTWFVNLESLQEHKDSRYSGKDDISDNEPENQDESDSGLDEIPEVHVGYASLHKTDARSIPALQNLSYQSDEHALMPVVTKKSSTSAKVDVSTYGEGVGAGDNDSDENSSKEEGSFTIPIKKIKTKKPAPAPTPAKETRMLAGQSDQNNELRDSNFNEDASDKVSVSRSRKIFGSAVVVGAVLFFVASIVMTAVVTVNKSGEESALVFEIPQNLIQTLFDFLQ